MKPKLLHEMLIDEVAQWRAASYAVADYPAVAEVLRYQTDDETGNLRFLRRPQFAALETYWYLRLVKGTPLVGDFYRDLANNRTLFPRRNNFVDYLGVPKDAYDEVDNKLDDLLSRIATDPDFVRRWKLEALAESLSLNYPSYILALTMGAGKTVLIGTIVATEFALALEYPKSQHPNADFVENALVFAPDLTVFGALRELSTIPYDQLLPEHLYQAFAPNFKPSFTRDGERDVAVMRGSSLNLIVTNTQKIRIRREDIQKKQLGKLATGQSEEAAKTDVANRRLQTIATLPYLAVFSDEAHHTYGQSLDELKQVRKTVDYLDDEARKLRPDGRGLVCVINTTGTPYYKKQPLRDVVASYGLAQGIADGILKEVRDGIRAYSFSDNNTAGFVAEVVRDFFRNYAATRLPDGSWAKLAIYFPQTDDLTKMRSIVEQELAIIGQPTDLVIENTANASADQLHDFDRFTSDPTSPHRIVLLINKGTEGWNCPSLFACALARELRGANNFVLQAATRCLRQVVGNTQPARIYLSDSNRKALDTQLKETYGEDTTISSLNRQNRQEAEKLTLHLLKPNTEPLYVTVPITQVQRKPGVQAAMTEFAFKPVTIQEEAAPQLSVYALDDGAGGLTQRSGSQQLAAAAALTDVYSVAATLAARYRLPSPGLRRSLLALYPGGSLPASHVPSLTNDLEQASADYEQRTRYVPVALAIVRKDGKGWQRGPDGNYTLTVNRPEKNPIMGEELLADLQAIYANPPQFGYHYAPYIFGSQTEANFLADLLNYLRANPNEVEDVYFTGGLTSSDKTDFYVEYTKLDGSRHRYFPDFLIRKRRASHPDSTAAQPGAALIVEIKSSQNRSTIEAQLPADLDAPVSVPAFLATATIDEARKTLYTLEWVQQSKRSGGNPLRYTIIFDNETQLLTQAVKEFINQPDTDAA